MMWCLLLQLVGRFSVKCIACIYGSHVYINLRELEFICRQQFYVIVVFYSLCGILLFVTLLICRLFISYFTCKSTFFYLLHPFLDYWVNFIHFNTAFIFQRVQLLTFLIALTYFIFNVKTIYISVTFIIKCLFLNENNLES